jgi:hypothetical protein
MLEDSTTKDPRMLGPTLRAKRLSKGIFLALLASIGAFIQRDFMSSFLWTGERQLLSLLTGKQ